MPKRQEETQRRVHMVAASFDICLQAYGRSPPFKAADQLSLHRQTIARRRELGSVEAALDDADFLHLVHETLSAWGIGKQGSHLRPYNGFAKALRYQARAIAGLDSTCIDDPALDAVAVGRQLFALIAQLDLVQDEAKLVAHSKALHHLVPELLPPIDRAWNGGRFFYLHSPEMQYHQDVWFGKAWSAFVYIARKAQLGKYVTHQGWRTSRSKLLDNALIGYCLVHRCPRAS